MQIDITGQNMEVSVAIRRRVEKSLERIGKRGESAPQRAHVVLAVNKHRHCCDVQLNVNGGLLVAKSESEDMYAAIDQTMEKLERQLAAAKRRQNDKRG